VNTVGPQHRFKMKIAIIHISPLNFVRSVSSVSITEVLELSLFLSENKDIKEKNSCGNN
jgi:hypothetical protein